MPNIRTVQSFSAGLWRQRGCRDTSPGQRQGFLQQPRIIPRLLSAATKEPPLAGRMPGKAGDLLIFYTVSGIGQKTDSLSRGPASQCSCVQCTSCFQHGAEDWTGRRISLVSECELGRWALVGVTGVWTRLPGMGTVWQESEKIITIFVL